MNKVLLCISYNTFDKKGFDAIIKSFEQWGYDIHVFDIGPSDSFNFDSLFSVVSDLRTGAEKQRVVILSNIRTAVFSWYRCFNWMLDDFIYFIDDNPAFTKTLHYEFFDALASFAGIDTEALQAKIYLNLSVDNYKKVLPFLLENRNSCYFDDFANFDPNEIPTAKERKMPKYVFKGSEYIFGNHLTVPETQERSVILLEPAAIPNHSDYSLNLEAAPFLLFYLILEMIGKEVISLSFNKVIFHFLRDSADQNLKNDFLDKTWRYLESNKAGFYAKVFLFSLLTLLAPQDQRVLKGLMETLLSDSNYLPYHYSIMIQILFYISHNLQLYPNFYVDQRQELDRLAGWYRSQLPIKTEKPREAIRNIAIHVDQLLVPLHSPSKLMLDYAKGLKKILPESKIKIFVEDNLYLHHQEAILPRPFSSRESKYCQMEHDRYLEDTDIDVFYADTEKTSFFSTQQLVNAICDFRPDIILSNSYISLATALLYDYSPTVYLSMGAPYFSCSADVYLVGIADLVLQNNSLYQLLDSTLIESINVGIDFPQPQQKKSRSDYGLKDSQFVMVTAGNRLNNEMSLDFTHEICNFILHHSDVVWLLVGLHSIPEFPSKESNSLLAGKVVVIPYEYDLVALYDLCDVFVNPVRAGGGFSIAWAMSRKLPVLQMDTLAAGLFYVGQENSIGSSLRNYGRELERLYGDANYRKEFGDRMYNRVQKFNLDATIASFIPYMELAEERFEKRLQKKALGEAT